MIDQGWWKNFREQTNNVGNDVEQQLVEMPALSNEKIVAMDEHGFYLQFIKISYSICLFWELKDPKALGVRKFFI